MNAVVLVALAVVGCGSSNDDGSKHGGGGSSGGGNSATHPLTPATIASYEGMYRLDSLTKNPTGCDSEGPSILAGEGDLSFVMVGTPDSTLGLGPCADESDCWDQIDTIRRGDPISGDYARFFGRQHDESSLYDVAYSAMEAGGMCTGRASYPYDLHRTGETVRGERRKVPLPDAPSCTNELAIGAEAEAVGRPCNELVVFGGTKTGPLPK